MDNAAYKQRIEAATRAFFVAKRKVNRGSCQKDNKGPSANSVPSGTLFDVDGYPAPGTRVQ